LAEAAAPADRLAGRVKGPGRVSLPKPLDRRFEACVFDWDGTAVADRAADGGKARDLFAALLARVSTWP
jgi:hypothetical protein